MRDSINQKYGMASANTASRLACALSLSSVFGAALASGVGIATPDTAGDVGRFTSLALDAVGNPVVSYHDLSKRDLKLLHCDDPNCAGDESGNIAIPDSLNMVGTYTSLILDTAGNPVVAYYDSSKGNLKLLHCDDPVCARDESGNAHVSDSSDNVGTYTFLVLDAAGNPVISYYDATHGDLKLMHCNNPGCIGDESGRISTPDIIGDVGLYTSLELDVAGNPVVSYHDASKGGLKLLHCNDSNCAGDETGNITTPDSGDVGWYSSLALDAAGNPVIGYYDFSNGDLKLLHCDDPRCSGNESGNIATPDSNGMVGAYLSMKLDAKGNPVISYYDSSNGDLKLLHCDDPNCAGNESANIATPDTAGDVGLYTSLALDAAGNPVVGYYDFSNGNLKLLHCTNPVCK